MRPLTAKEEEYFKKTVDAVTPDDEEHVKKELPGKMRKLESKGAFLELIDNVKLLYSLLTDKRWNLAWKTKAIILGALIYFISPADMLPDFIPFLGYIDDTAVLAAVMKMLMSEIDEYREFRKKHGA